MKVVIDTNVFISSFFNPEGLPRKIIDLWKTGEIVLCLSPEILEEYFKVLLRFGLQEEPEIEELLALFKKKINIVFTAADHRLDVVSADPDDNKFLECAEAAKAKVIISGDKHLKDLKAYKGIAILSTSAFTRHWQEKG